MKFFNKIKGFTLAEVMITLMIIGIISAIAIPVALNSKPDENLIKFKKAHETLYQVINTLVTSDKYYLAGDLGVKADGTLLIQDETTHKQYLCQTFADLLSTKAVNCSNATYTISDSHRLLSNERVGDIATGTVPCIRPVTQESIAATKEIFDGICKENAIPVGAEIVTTDDITYYNAGPKMTFGYGFVNANNTNSLEEDITDIRYFSPPDQHPANYADDQGNDIAYKVFCVDVDGIPKKATKTDCKNECPFGYGIRADGRILPGARAEEWLKKDISGKKEDEES